MPSPFGLPFDEPDAGKTPAPQPPSPAPTAPTRTSRSERAAEPLVPTRPASPPPTVPSGSQNRAADASSPQVTPQGKPAATERTRQVLSVTALTVAIRDQLESEFFSVWVEGELSNCRLWNTGHLYFTLKDDRAQIKGVMFRTQLRYLRFKPEDGQRVIARGRVSVYEPKGEYQLTCEHLEPRGLGELQLAFEQLKKRLQAEGLFDDARKRPLPPLPRTIAIVTSLDGAAIRDMLKVLQRRHNSARVVIRSTRVQGEGSALEIAQAIRAVARVPGVDVLIVGRGGGSIEDLWAFNEEVVARAIADCHVPVISAVGHESDVTIADFVADRRAPTPSAAAEIVVAAKEELRAQIESRRDRLDAAVFGRIQTLSRRVHVLGSRPALAGFPTRLALRGRDVMELTHHLHRAMRDGRAVRERRLSMLARRLDAFDPGQRLGGLSARLAAAESRMHTAASRRVERARARMLASVGRLDSLSPLAVLSRGYAVAWNADRTHALRDAADVGVGDRIKVTLARGELECDVRSKE